MESDLAQEAINAALACNWAEAIKINLLILKETPDDIDALNRIAKAYAEEGKITKAKSFTQKVLKLDPLNAIANRCSLKWKSFKKDGKHDNSFTVNSSSFIEIPTKTKTISLINPGDNENIANLECGELVILSPSAHRLNVLSNNKYIGRFPDDQALKFIQLIKAGKKYQAVIKTTGEKQIEIYMLSI